jgi:hypothetical protein
MGKYDDLKSLKKTKARTAHECFRCGGEIAAGTEYYKEQLSDPHLQLPRARKFCLQCHAAHGDALLTQSS